MGLDILDDFLPADVIPDIIGFMHKTKPIDSRKRWQDYLHGGQILLWGLDGELGRRVVYGLLKGLDRASSWTTSPNRAALTNGEWALTLHAGQQGSYIPWHNDANHDYAITVYLTEWEKDWGGFLTIEGDQPWFSYAVVPKYNRAVCMNGGHLHCVTPLTAKANVRISLQAFAHAR